MTNKSMLFSLDFDSLEYLETIPKTKRSLVVREALELHKYRHRPVNNTENAKIKVKLSA